MSLTTIVLIFGVAIGTFGGADPTVKSDIQYPYDFTD